MKLYRTTWIDHTDDSGPVKKAEWQGTQADATAKRKALKAGPAVSHIETEDVDVPTDKAGLLAWLNANTVGE